MKTLFLTLSMLISTVLVKTEVKQNNFIGTWKSDGSNYTMLITKKNKNLEIYNYYFEVSNLDNVKTTFLETVEEKVVRFNNRKMKTTIFYKENNHRVSVTYKIINKEKMKAIFKGDWNGTIYYNKQNN
tara:strand:- start:832 stop:1215 length:384 start_codon:yes stop_codon:yes gene_type:complete